MLPEESRGNCNPFNNFSPIKLGLAFVPQRLNIKIGHFLCEGLSSAFSLHFRLTKSQMILRCKHTDLVLKSYPAANEENYEDICTT
jgi:hypothetical protein